MAVVRLVSSLQLGDDPGRVWGLLVEYPSTEDASLVGGRVGVAGLLLLEAEPKLELAFVGTSGIEVP